GQRQLRSSAQPDCRGSRILHRAGQPSVSLLHRRIQKLDAGTESNHHTALRWRGIVKDDSSKDFSRTDITGEASDNWQRTLYSCIPRFIGTLEMRGVLVLPQAPLCTSSNPLVFRSMSVR